MGKPRKSLTPEEVEHWAAVAARLKKLRGARTKAGMAQLIPVTARAYDLWEKGASRITDANQKRLADVHGVSQEYILYGHDKPTDARTGQLDRIETLLEEVLSRLPARDAAEEYEQELDEALPPEKTPSPKVATSGRSARRQAGAG